MDPLMKKEYQKPLSEVLDVRAEGIICVSKGDEYESESW